MDDEEFSDSEMWHAHKEAGQQKRAHNRESSPKALSSAGISYIEHNGGAHLVCTHKGFTADFWPGTGKFIFRTKGGKGRGVKNLINRYRGFQNGTSENKVHRA